MKQLRRVALIAFSLVLGLSLISALDESMEDADIENDEGGVQIITGTLNISSPIIIRNTIDSVIILEDQGGFVARDVDFVFPVNSQILAQITPDPNEYTGEEPIEYRLPLPIAPAGTMNDVDNDGDEDSGVQIYQTAWWDNTVGDPFIRELEGGSWSGSYSSAVTSDDPGDDNYLGLNGGWILVWSPDDEQGFPSGFGADGQLFTEDDPIVRIPAGYTAVNLDTEVFTFDRSNTVNFDLNEAESIPPSDYSELSYTEAFDALIEEAKEVYPYADLKDVDWDALAETYRPRFEEAEANEDINAYLLALRDFSWEIPDSHVGVSAPGTTVLDLEFIQQTEGGLGLSLIELDSGEIIINYLTTEGPAELAGIQRGAVVTAINGEDIQDAVAAVRPYSLPFSSEEFGRLQQLRYVVRFPHPTEVELTIQNPGADEETLTLETIQERDSFSFTSVYRDLDRTAAPAEFDFLDDGDGYGYVKLQSFSGNEEYIVNTWDYFLQVANGLGTPGIIVDLRTNTGGSSAIAARLVSYFFEGEDPVPLYYNQGYNRYIDDFFYDERFPTEIDPANSSGLKYTGEVVVLVAPGCASACEYMAYMFSPLENVTFMGQYASAAMAGGIPPLYMPEGVNFSLPVVAPIDYETGEFIIEGTGIQPEVRVPVTMETALSEEDVVLNAAVDYLDEATALEIIDGGELAPGAEVSGDIAAKTRVQYASVLPGGIAVDILLTGETADGEELDTVLNIYDSTGENLLASNDDLNGETVTSGFEALAAGDVDFPVILEVATFEDAFEGTYTLTLRETGSEEADMDEDMPAATEEADMDEDMPAATEEADIDEDMPDATEEADMEMTPEAESTEESDG